MSSGHRLFDPTDEARREYIRRFQSTFLFPLVFVGYISRNPIVALSAAIITAVFMELCCRSSRDLQEPPSRDDNDERSFLV